jgi:hypothetical protein
MTRTLRRRLHRRGVSPYVWLPIPVVHPYTERLRRAAVGDHVCGYQMFALPAKETR